MPARKKVIKLETDKTEVKQPVVLDYTQKVEKYKAYVKLLNTKLNAQRNKLQLKGLSPEQRADTNMLIIHIETDIEAKTAFWEHYLNRMMQDGVKQDNKDLKK